MDLFVQMMSMPLVEDTGTVWQLSSLAESLKSKNLACPVDIFE
jgi:hypothetical protein